MTFNETAVVAIGLLAGYWVIDALLNRQSVNQNKNTANNQGNESKASVNESGSSTDYEQYISSNWYRILGVAEGATAEQIAEAYQQMIVQYHPDKIAHMGAEFRDLATFKSKQIEDAYNYAASMIR